MMMTNKNDSDNVSTSSYDIREGINDMAPIPLCQNQAGRRQVQS